MVIMHYGVMNTHITIDKRTVERYEQDYIDSKRDAESPSELFTDWFAAICVLWAMALHHCQRRIEWSEDQLYKAIVGLNTHLSLRDAFILTAMEEIPLRSILTLVTHPWREFSSELVKHSLIEIFENPDATPQRDRIECAIDLLQQLKVDFDEQYNVCIYAMTAYWRWWMGDIDEAREMNDRALSIDQDYSLSRIINTVLIHELYPAWYRREHGIPEKCETKSNENSSTQAGEARDTVDAQDTQDSPFALQSVDTQESSESGDTQESISETSDETLTYGRDEFDDMYDADTDDRYGGDSGDLEDSYDTDGVGDEDDGYNDIDNQETDWNDDDKPDEFIDYLENYDYEDDDSNWLNG